MSNCPMSAKLKYMGIQIAKPIEGLSGDNPNWGIGKALKAPHVFEVLGERKSRCNSFVYNKKFRSRTVPRGIAEGQVFKAEYVMTTGNIATNLRTINY